MAHRYYNRMDASFIYLWYGCNNVTYSSYDTYNTYMYSVQYIWPYCQTGANCTYGACGTYGAYGTCGTCGTFGAYGACGTYVTHVPYLQMVHISMDLPNSINMCLQMGPKIK